MDAVTGPAPSDESRLERLAGHWMIGAVEATDGWTLQARRRLLGALMAVVWAPMLGWPGAIRDTLQLVRPDLSARDRRRLVRRAARHAGEGLAELLSPDAFLEELAHTPIMGPGIEAMKRATENDRGVILVTAQIGQPDAILPALALRGLPVAAQASPVTDGALDQRIEAARQSLGGTYFAPDADGAAAFEAHISAAGIGVIMADAPDATGTPVRLFGARVRTPRLPATIALCQHAEMIPTFALRRPEGGYGIWMASSIAHGHPEEMLQAFQSSVEAVARAYAEQFFWASPRWQPERYLS